MNRGPNKRSCVTSAESANLGGRVEAPKPPDQVVPRELLLATTPIRYGNRESAELRLRQRSSNPSKGRDSVRPPHAKPRSGTSKRLLPDNAAVKAIRVKGVS